MDLCEPDEEDCDEANCCRSAPPPDVVCVQPTFGGIHREAEEEVDSDGWEDEEQHRCATDTAELLCIENDFTLVNSFWFAIGTLMQQGSDLNPKVPEIRTIYIFLKHMFATNTA